MIPNLIEKPTAVNYNIDNVDTETSIECEILFYSNVKDDNAIIHLGIEKEKENSMRLDKYLKVSRLIKRRTVANEACDAGRVLINDKVAKASTEVKVGDVIEIGFGTKSVKVEVLDIQDTTKKDEAKDLFKYL